MRKTVKKHRQNQSVNVKQNEVVTPPPPPSVWLGGEQMWAHVLCVSVDITVSASGLTR